MLSTAFRVETKSAPRAFYGSFYRGYNLSPYQYQMLFHLLEEDVPSYTVIPDWQNLFIITLLYAHMSTPKHKKVVVYSAWPLKDVLSVLQDVPDFYELYEEVIADSLQIVHVEFGRQLKNRVHADYHLGMGTAKEIRVGAQNFVPDLSLTLKQEFTDFAKIHPAYVEEQTHPVWVINDEVSYQITEERFNVDKPIGKRTLHKYRYFDIDGTYENNYALYSLLARSGDGQKMMKNYFSYPVDYGWEGYSKGNYLLPLKFYLELPSWLRLGKDLPVSIDQELSYLELILSTHSIDAPRNDEARIREYAIRTCGRFQHQLPAMNSSWVLIDPTKGLCDTVVVSDRLGGISVEAEKSLRDAQLAQKIRRNLERSINEPLSRTTYTIDELRTMARERGVDLKRLKTKADIARAILAQL